MENSVEHALETSQNQAVGLAYPECRVCTVAIALHINDCKYKSPLFGRQSFKIPCRDVAGRLGQPSIYAMRNGSEQYLIFVDLHKELCHVN